MANSLVKLTLESNQYEKGMRQAQKSWNDFTKGIGISMSKFTAAGAAIGAVTGALKVAKDAFFKNEQQLDEWGRVVQSSQSLYGSFLNTLNNGDFSGFFRNIDNVVKAYGISKKLIEIEITETSDEFPASVLKEFVSSLHELGYKVAVDDFGCGAASLSLLRETAFDTLKIDKGFIHSAFDKNLTILTHIVNLAKAIDMKIVAEGVETQKQKEILLGLGVNVVQGYYYDRPLPKEEMLSRITGKVYSA